MVFKRSILILTLIFIGSSSIAHGILHSRDGKKGDRPPAAPRGITHATAANTSGALAWINTIQKIGSTIKPWWEKVKTTTAPARATLAAEYERYVDGVKQDPRTAVTTAVVTAAVASVITWSQTTCK